MDLGSFTGIRIGLSTVKGLANVHNIPLIAVSSLEALVYNVYESNGYICSLIDARNNQVYCGIFDKEYNLCEDYIADDINNVIHKLNKYTNITFVGNGAYLDNTFLNTAPKNADSNIHSKNIGIAGYNKYKQGIYDLPDSILPIYLRASQAERIRNENG